MRHGVLWALTMPLNYGVDWDCDTMQAVVPSAKSERAVPKTAICLGKQCMVRSKPPAPPQTSER